MRYLKNKGKFFIFTETISYHKYIPDKQKQEGRNMQLNYQLTDEDYIEFNEFHQLIHSEVGKRNLFKLRLIGPMISILAIVIFILVR